MYTKIIKTGLEARQIRKAFEDASAGLLDAPPKREYIRKSKGLFHNGSLSEFLNDTNNPGNKMVLRRLLSQSPLFLSVLHDIAVICMYAAKDVQANERFDAVREAIAKAYPERDKPRMAEPQDIISIEWKRLNAGDDADFGRYNLSEYIDIILLQQVPEIVLSLADIAVMMRRTGSRRQLGPEVFSMLKLMYTMEVDEDRFLVPQARQSGYANGMAMLTTNNWERSLGTLGVNLPGEEFAPSMDYAPMWVQKLFLSHLLQQHSHYFVDAKVLLRNLEEVESVTKWSQLYYGASMISAIYSHGDNSVTKTVGKYKLMDAYKKRVVEAFPDSYLGSCLDLKTEDKVIKFLRTGPMNADVHLKKMAHRYFSLEGIATMIPEVHYQGSIAKVMFDTFGRIVLPYMRARITGLSEPGIFARMRDAMLEYNDATARKSTVRGEIQLGFSDLQKLKF